MHQIRSFFRIAVNLSHNVKALGWGLGVWVGWLVVRWIGGLVGVRGDWLMEESVG